MAGDFTSVNGGTPSNGLVAVDSTTGIASAWSPPMNIGGNVSTLMISGSNLFVGSWLDPFTFSSQTRSGAAAISTSDGSLQAWNPQVNGTVNAIPGHNVPLVVLGLRWLPPVTAALAWPSRTPGQARTPWWAVAGVAAVAIAFGADQHWQQGLTAYAMSYAAQVKKDYLVYFKAYKAGYFSPAP